MDHYLLKFFKETKYIEEFRTGKIRLMSAYHYATMEQSALLYNNRFDSTEGEAFLFHNTTPNEPKTLQFGNGASIKLGAGVQMMLFNGGNPNEQIKLSSYYLIDKDDIPDGKFSTVLDTMKDSLGEYYIAFHDPEAFANRIQASITKLKEEGKVTNFTLDRVKYYNAETFSGFSNPLDKPNGLAWQREYRLLVHTVCEKDPFFLDIGDIKDITIWGTKEDLHNGYVVNDMELFIPNHRR